MFVIKNVIILKSYKQNGYKSLVSFRVYRKTKCLRVKFHCVFKIAPNAIAGRCCLKQF